MNFLYGILLIFTSLALTLGNHQDKVTISPSSMEVVYFVNNSHIVTCSGHKGTKIQWLNPKGKPVIETKGRVHVEDRGSLSTGTLALVFEQISLADKGNWTCAAIDSDVRRNFRMIVNEQISFMDTPIVQSIRENKDGTIRCEVRGNPEPTVLWHFNGQPIPLPHPKYTKLADGLLIKKVSKNDSGEYTCKAFQVSTELSNVDEQTIRLNVQHKPIAPTKASAKIAFGYLNGVTNISCEAEAEPAANFTWYRHGKKISTKNYSIFNGQHISYLQVMINDSNVYGDYKCKASNMLGVLERVITLQEGTKPDPPSTFTLRGVNFDTLDVDVGAVRQFTAPPNEMDITGYRFQIISIMQYEKNGGSWSDPWEKDFPFEDGITYLLKPLTPDTGYLVRVATRNIAGLSDYTEAKEFRTQKLQPHGFSSEAIMLKTTKAQFLFSTIIIILIPNTINIII